MKDTTSKRAAKLLEDASRLVISLKLTRNSNPLQVVVLDNIEADLREMNELIVEELKKPLEEANGWGLLNLLFKKISNQLYKILASTPRYKYFLLRQKLIYTHSL